MVKNIFSCVTQNLFNSYVMSRSLVRFLSSPLGYRKMSGSVGYFAYLVNLNSLSWRSALR